MMIHQEYSVWRDRGEQWDADDIDPPAITSTAESFADAAEFYLNCCLGESDGDVTLIVRNNASGEYRRIESARSWRLKSEEKTSLEELCEP